MKPENESNIFLMSLILFLGTFIISVILKDFKNSLFFPSKVIHMSFKMSNRNTDINETVLGSTIN